MDVCGSLGKSSTEKLQENNIFLLWMPPNPKKNISAGHINDNTPRDWSLVVSDTHFGIFFRGKSPEGRKKRIKSARRVENFTYSEK